jgi:hypothetical protein
MKTSSKVSGKENLIQTRSSTRFLARKTKSTCNNKKGLLYTTNYKEK